jgi:hypothetical protein
MSGWIKIYRKIQEKGFYKKSEYFLLWVHILLKANHFEKEFFFNNKAIKIKKGQLLTGRKKLSSETGINESKIERILKYLENEQQIEQQKTNKFRLITIQNYNQYQKSEQQSEQQVNNKRTTSEQQVNTNKNNKNYKNEKKSIIKILKKPSLEEIQKYCKERKNNVNPNKFFNWYESNGWKVGKNPMKDWRAAIRTWEESKGSNNDGLTAVQYPDEVKYKTEKEIDVLKSKHLIREKDGKYIYIG